MLLIKVADSQGAYAIQKYYLDLQIPAQGC